MTTILPVPPPAGFSVENLAVSLSGRPVLRGIDLALGGAGVTGLIGPNGAGKTTLLKTMMGFLPPAAGEARFGGQALAAWEPQALARRVGYLAQGSPCSWPMSVERVVAIGRTPHLSRFGRPGAADAAAVERAMAATGVAHLRRRPVTDLSGGERVRVMLARALAGCPEVLLADEPVAGLDPHYQLQVMETLRDFAAEGRGVVVVLHDLTLAARFCARLVLLHGGRVMADGTPEEVLTPGLLEAAYGVTVHVGRHGGGLYVLPWEVSGGSGLRAAV
ncbi:ABC transporter ATP-binding protein [Oleispirillum naphthae]|uniref:ABC transporter ATP-binding protein n=1 Tax=Oleispirillum naphthae TaxID=2838853 RepID=UPI00308235EF